MLQSMHRTMLSRSGGIRCRPVASAVSKISPLAPSTRSLVGDTKPEPTTSSSSQAKDTKLSGPEPKPFTVGSGQLGAVTTAALGVAARAGSGLFVQDYRWKFQRDDGEGYSVLRTGGFKFVEYSKTLEKFPRPELALQLFEFEACPYCKKVREALTKLDLDAVIYPCPKEGPTWRKYVSETGGKAQFPYLIDPNAGNKAMYESDVIVHYLYTMYGNGDVPPELRYSITIPTASVSSMLRPNKGRTYRPSRVPDQPLVLWGYEGSPFVKLVREVISELELPYLLVTCGRGSPKRLLLKEKRGHFQVPYLEDPNTGIAMFESSAIIKYLEDTYAITA